MLEVIILSGVFIMLWHCKVQLQQVNDHLTRLRDNSNHFKLKDIRESKDND